MTEVRCLLSCSLEVIQQAFLEAFQDYAVAFSAKDLTMMMQRRGFDPKISFGAFAGDRLVAFTLNGLGDWNGKYTSYDVATGTVPEFRGKGLAKSIFQESLPFLRSAGIEQYLLEVLQENSKAISVYRSIGFEVSREFRYYKQVIQDLRFKEVNLCDGYVLQAINILENQEAMEICWDFQPSWQNSFDSIHRNLTPFVALAVLHQSILCGYCVFEPISGDITQIAVLPRYRRQGIASILIKESIKSCCIASVKLINVLSACESLDAFAQAINLPRCGEQYEMIKSI